MRIRSDRRVLHPVGVVYQFLSGCELCISSQSVCGASPSPCQLLHPAITMSHRPLVHILQLHVASCVSTMLAAAGSAGLLLAGQRCTRTTRMCAVTHAQGCVTPASFRACQVHPPGDVDIGLGSMCPPDGCMHPRAGLLAGMCSVDAVGVGTVRTRSVVNARWHVRYQWLSASAMSVPARLLLVVD
jgi:hypothetical protein